MALEEQLLALTAKLHDESEQLTRKQSFHGSLGRFAKKVESVAKAELERDRSSTREETTQLLVEVVQDVGEKAFNRSIEFGDGGCFRNQLILIKVSP